MMRGIHPGQCAVVFHGGAGDKLFPPEDGGLATFVQLVNELLRATPAKNHAGHMLQISPDIEKTLLYSRNLTSTSGPAVGEMPLFSEMSSGADGAETVAFETERHAEVRM